MLDFLFFPLAVLRMVAINISAKSVFVENEGVRMVYSYLIVYDVALRISSSTSRW